MRFFQSIRRLAVPVAAVLLVGVVGCPKQEDFPTALDVVVPPTPTNFAISNVGTNYTFQWDISDPAVVDRYRVYLLGGTFAPDEIIFETNDTSDTYDVGLALTGLQFAVTAISTDSIEGEAAIATAP